MKSTKILAIWILVLVLSTEIANADFTFGTPLNMGPILNSSAIDECQFSSSDGLELYFQSDRPGGYGTSNYSQGIYGRADDLYVSTRETTQDPWGEPVNLGPIINTSGLEATPCLTPDGLKLYFMSNRPGGSGDFDLWVTTRATTNDDWETPANLGPNINSGAYEASPNISTDGLTLYFDSVRAGGYGGPDLWMTSRPTISDPWGEPVNLGPIVNSSSDDGKSTLSADGRMLFFQSNRSGGYDLWLTSRATPDDDWGQPVNLGRRVNTSGTEADPAISADGCTLYFMSGRNGGYGSRDMWQVSIDPVVDLNGDCIVDGADMCIMLDYWGTDEPSCDIGPMPWGDGVVDIEDLTVLAEHLFEAVCPGDNAIERRISAGSDDAEEALTAGYNNWNESSDLELVHDYIDNGGPQLVGMTFRDIDIAPGEVISEAYIEFVCDEIINGTLDAYFLIWGHLTENSEGFVEPFVISNRLQTEAKVPWEPDTWDAGGQTIRTVNIAPIIQELIDQPGWVAGNAVEIIIGADSDKPAFSGRRVAISYDRSPSSAPLLHIEIADLAAQ